MDSIRENIKRIQTTLPPSVKLMAVTKQRSVEEIRQAIGAGISVIGENYVQEAQDKYPYLFGVEKHFIGHLQRNKVKKALEIFDWIDSVDSLFLAQEISKKALRTTPILIQVNAGKEVQKSGCMPHDSLDLIKQISVLPNIAIKGLMIVTPMTTILQLQQLFEEMHDLFVHIRQENIPNVDMNTLSMGMSSDYALAVQQGSTLVRMGEGIFGQRK